MKKLLMMAVMALTLAPCFSDTLTVPVGNGESKELGGSWIKSGNKWVKLNGDEATGYEKDDLDYYGDEYNDAYYYSLLDANNDGYLDIVEGNSYWMGFGFNSSNYRLYMYNPKTRGFEKAVRDDCGMEDYNDLFEDLEIHGDGTITTNSNTRNGGETVYFPVAEYKWTGSKWHCYKTYP